MTARLALGSIGFHLTTDTQAARQPREDEPFQLLVIGDFSGRANRGQCDPTRMATLKPLVVDVDNLEELPARLGTQLCLPLGPEGTEITLSFKTLEDFHPDQIYDQVELFSALRSTRQRLQNRSSFDMAAAEVRSWATGSAPPTGADQQQTPSPQTPSQQTPNQETAKSQGAPQGDLARLLGGDVSLADSGSADPTLRKAEQTVESLLKQVVGRYIVPADEPQKEELISSVDHAASDQMRALLHHRHFQALEACWRGLEFLTQRIETDESLKILVLDVTDEELAADVTSQEDLSQTGLWKQVVQRTVHTPGANRYAAVVLNRTLAASLEDATLVARLAQLAQQATAPLLAAASGQLVGCESLVTQAEPKAWTWKPSTEVSEAWQELAQLPAAEWVGLIWPRFLLRLPYGCKTEPCERFDFEENPAAAGHLPGPQHDRYLWGNGALAAATLLAISFKQSGWSFRPGQVQDLDGLPVHIFSQDGDSQAHPVGEGLLTDQAVEAVLSGNLMPLISMKDRDVARLRFQSLAGTPLAGRWPG